MKNYTPENTKEMESGKGVLTMVLKVSAWTFSVWRIHVVNAYTRTSRSLGQGNVFFATEIRMPNRNYFVERYMKI